MLLRALPATFVLSPTPPGLQPRAGEGLQGISLYITSEKIFPYFYHWWSGNSEDNSSPQFSRNQLRKGEGRIFGFSRVCYCAREHRGTVPIVITDLSGDGGIVQSWRLNQRHLNWFVALPPWAFRGFSRTRLIYTAHPGPKHAGNSAKEHRFCLYLLLFVIH